MANVTLTAPPGYGPVAPLDKQKHAGLGLKPDRDYRWCTALNAMYITVAEFGRAGLDYPIAFTREAKTGLFTPVAVLGLMQKNLFVDAAGRWRAHTYVPSYARRHPFCTASLPPADGKPAQNMVCVQEDQLARDGKPLFDERGEPTAEWTALLKLIEAVEGARAQTEELAKHLESLGLMTAFDAVALPRDGQQMRLQGLFRVDEDKLRKVPPRELRAMLSRGELRAVYAHLLSLENFARLLDLSQEETGTGG